MRNIGIDKYTCKAPAVFLNPEDIGNIDYHITEAGDMWEITLNWCDAYMTGVGYWHYVPIGKVYNRTIAEMLVEKLKRNKRTMEEYVRDHTSCEFWVHVDEVYVPPDHIPHLEGVIIPHDEKDPD